MRIFLIITILISVGYIIYTSFEKRAIIKQLRICLKEGRFDEFDRLRNRSRTEDLLGSYPMMHLDLVKAIMVKDEGKIDTVLDEVMQEGYTQKQRALISEMIFNYYVATKNVLGGARAMQVVEASGSPVAIKNVEILYDVFLANGYKYLEQVQEQFNRATKEEQKISMASLLTQMYLNKGDETEATHYKEMIESFIKKRNLLK